MKLIKIFLKIILISMSLVVLLAGTFWFFPDLVFSRPLRRLYIPAAQKKGLSFEELNLGAESKSFFKKEFSLSGKKICLDRPIQAKNCIEKIDLEFVLDLTKFQLKKIELRRLFLVLAAVNWNLEPSAAAETEETSSLDLQKWLDRLEVGDVELSVPKLTITKQRKDFLDISFALSNQENKFQSAGLARLNKVQKLEVHWDLKGPQLRRFPDLFNLETAKLSVKTDNNIAADLSLKSKNQNSRTGQLNFRDPKNKVIFPFTLLLKPDSLELSSIKASFKSKSLPASVFLEDFKGLVEWRNSNLSDLKKVSASGAVGIRTKEFLKDHSKIRVLPPRMQVLLKVDLNSEPEKKLKGFAELQAAANLEKILDLDLLAKYAIDFNSQEKTGSADWKGTLRIRDFKSWAALMNGVGLMIPSPIHVLEGRVVLDLEGQMDIESRELKSQVNLMTDLSSQEQSLNLEAVGSLAFKPCIEREENAELLVDLESKKVRIKLPNIDYKSPPALIRDSRFVNRNEKKKVPGCQLSYHAKLKSGAGFPAEIAGPIFKKPLPIQYSVNLKDKEKTQGFVKIKNYESELFRRNAKISHLNLDLESRIVDGRAQLNYTDYKVFMNLSGKVDSIRMELESDPPLPREDLFAILIFGRPLNGLDDDESGSASNMNAAAKDGALTMASLYIFASTPIESVGYNPHTKGLTAKVRLASGTSLNVGVNEDRMTDLGITRRIAPQWRLRSTVQDPTEREERSASALLEWFKRF